MQELLLEIVLWLELTKRGMPNKTIESVVVITDDSLIINAFHCIEHFILRKKLSKNVIVRGQHVTLRGHAKSLDLVVLQFESLLPYTFLHLCEKTFLLGTN